MTQSMILSRLSRPVAEHSSSPKAGLFSGDEPRYDRCHGDCHLSVMAATGIAHADPVAPQAGAPCWGFEASSVLYDAQTLTPQSEVLVCVKTDQGSQWQHLDGFQRPVETWFTYGPATT